MKLSKNLKRMIGFSMGWSVLFFGILHWSLFSPEHRWPIILTAAIIYGLGFAAAGYGFGKRDDQSKVRYNLSIRYALSGTISSFIVGGLWVLFFRHEELDTLAWMGFGLLVQILILTIVNRHTIKGMPHKELFK